MLCNHPFTRRSAADRGMFIPELHPLASNHEADPPLWRNAGQRVAPVHNRRWENRVAVFYGN